MTDRPHPPGSPDTPAEEGCPGVLGRSLADKNAVVTGAASGIGAAITKRLANAGAHVTAVDVERAAVEAVADKAGCQAKVVDLSDPEAAATVGTNSDIVVNNAGFQHMAPVHQFPPETFATMLNLMVESPFRIVRAALPGMYERGWGRVVNISSVYGVRAARFKSAYVTAKHGLEGLSKAIALEGAGYGVTSNCVCPGYVRTPLVQRQVLEHAELHRVPHEQVIEDVLLSKTPVKRLVEPDEVAALALWLCGPGTSSVTGSSFSMDGGWSAQ